MLEFLNHLIFSQRFIPDGYCYPWQPELAWLHLVSDILITLAYYSIPVMLMYVVQQQRDVPFPKIFWLFSTFAITCGTTHLLEVRTLWYPAYWVSGVIKALTAVVSLFTALELYPIISNALALPSSTQLEMTNIEITDRKRAEQERDRFFTTSVDLLCIVGMDGYFKRLNPAFETTLGYSQEELLAKPFIEFVHPEDRAKTLTEFQRGLTGNLSKIFENRYRCKDGSYKWLAWTGTVFPEDSLVYGAGRDITERKRFESELRALTWREREKAEQLEIALQKLKRTQTQLLQNEKMASLGQMVAGIAHEINNPVSFIYSNIKPASDYTQDLLHLLQLYQEHYPQPVSEIREELKIVDLNFVQEDFPKLLESMQEGANRIGEIVSSLRNFSRLDEAELKQVDIHEGIDNTLLILQHRLKQESGHPEIQVIKEYGQLPQVECYASQLNQVFINLLSNAIDALELGHGSWGMENGKNNEFSIPTIWIRTSVCANGRGVIIRIADNGIGMAEAVQSQIFDPFFTTKPPGQGTGLGLSISHQIVVERHGGQLRCHSTLEQGTEFVIELPIRQGRTADQKQLRTVPVTIS